MGDPIWNNPFLQNAISILDQIADLGKTVPFIAPTFVILKVIIEIEKKARDVDVKCNDLLERVTFMVGHLSVLKSVELSPSTQQVIERMNVALKNAAALISTYRKQGRVSRRLKFGNRDKFISCADAINVCSNDLMMSLQIHQTSRLDLITRGVPIDPEDEAAQTFISTHGSFDTIKQSRTLVEKFAQQENLPLDDNIMEDLNSSIADAMQQTEARLEGILKENVGAAVVDGLKGLAAELNKAEAEQRFVCVQCEKEFRDSTNGPKACSYHPAEYSSWSKRFPCCGTTNPCQFGTHRANHHCDYPYGPFFKRSMAIQNYVDTVDKWTSVEDTDLTDNSTQTGYVGALLRWVSRGERLDEPTILISIGTVWYNTPYFFDTFTAKELASVSRVVGVTRQKLIYRTSPSNTAFAMAEWELSSAGDIIGVRLTAKTATSDTPFVNICPIDISTCKNSGDVIVVSKGGMCAYKPDQPYVLPEMIRVGPELSDKPLRAARTNFRTRAPPNMRVVMKAISDPPLTANPKVANKAYDIFEGTVSIYNNHATSSDNAITISSVSATFRLVGDKEYSPVKSCKVDMSLFPFSLEPRNTMPLQFEIQVPRSEEDVAMDVRWWNRAFIARHRPIRIKLIIEEIEGEEFSLVLEYVFQPFPLEHQKDGDLAFFYFDNPKSLDRSYVHVRPADYGKLISFEGTDIDAKQLQKAVYEAIKTNETEIDLGIGQEKMDGVWEWKVWALVDLSCRRVYAFKVLLSEGKLVTKKRFSSFGYVLCPDYGDITDEVRPIRCATEKIKLPELEPYSMPDIVADDTIDDNVPEPPKPPQASIPLAANGTSPHGPTTTQLSVSDDLTRRLNSIDTNLSRIATALEQLVYSLRTR
ncbi:hypothetical protein BU17DRAFT_57364 [Hysterangium stoloniferum]|nr:hypothetical protein BU17DRAFT_57364 [Hysterangium stoloniferum]